MIAVRDIMQSPQQRITNESNSNDFYIYDCVGYFHPNSQWYSIVRQVPIDLVCEELPILAVGNSHVIIGILQ